MYAWYQQIQQVVDAIDQSIERRDDQGLTLQNLAYKLGYSAFHTTRKFKELSGMSLREYLRMRRLAFALIDVRDTQKHFLDIAVDYGFSSHEAFTRAFKSAYGTTPKSYRENPIPVVLRTKINTFDRYILGIGEIGMIKATDEIKIYYVTIPAHKFLYIKNYDSDGYFDFWEKQKNIPGQDCDTICGLLESIKGKLDGKDEMITKFSGQIMANIYEEDGRSPTAYGVRLPLDYSGPIPEQMLLMDVPEAEYITFEHGPFDFAQQCESVNRKLEESIRAFNFDDTAYKLDKSPGQIGYWFFDPEDFNKKVLPVTKK